MKKDKPTILIVNDDGITAPGIKALMETMAEIGRVVVVAPDSPQSGMGACHYYRQTVKIR
jgi:5'-nucleotidase